MIDSQHVSNNVSSKVVHFTKKDFFLENIVITLYHMIMMFALFVGLMIYLFKITASLRKPFIKTRTQLQALQSFHRFVAKDLILIKNLN